MPPSDAIAQAQRRRAWARKTANKIPTKWLWVGAAGIVVATTAMFGGLNDATETFPEARLGEPVDLGAARVTIDEVTLTDVLPPGTEGFSLDETPADRDVLTVRVTITNTNARTFSIRSVFPSSWGVTEPVDEPTSEQAPLTDETGVVTFLQTWPETYAPIEVDLDGVAGPFTFSTVDQTASQYLGPLMTTTVTQTYLVPEDFRERPDVTIDLRTLLYSQFKFLGSQADGYWESGNQVARGTFPITRGGDLP